MRSRPLLAIKADDPQRIEAIEALDEVLTPITYEEAAIEIGRWLMHYPRRHVDQDAVIIQDLADEFELRKFGIGIVIVSLREIRNEYREGNPWVPQTGYVIETVKENQALYADILKRMSRPELPALQAPEPQTRGVSDPYEGKFWAQFEDWEREQFLTDLLKFDVPIRAMTLRAYHAPHKLTDSETIYRALGREYPEDEKALSGL